MLKLFGHKSVTPVSFFNPIEPKSKICFEDYWGENCHHLYAQTNNLDKAKQFIEMGLPLITNLHGIHPLHVVAMYTGNVEFSEWILHLNSPSQIISVEMPDVIGRTPLHFAANGYQVDFIRQYVTAENVNIRDKRGCTPIMACCMGAMRPDNAAQRAATFEHLFSLGADLKVSDSQGRTAHQYAAYYFPYLLKYFGELPCRQIEDPKNYFGANSLTQQILKQDYSKLPNYRELDSIQDALNFTAAHSFCYLEAESARSKKVLFQLTEISAIPVDQPNLTGVTPLHIAATLGKDNFFELMLSQTIYMNLTDANGRSYVIAACIPTRNEQNEDERINIIKALEQRRADFLTRDRFGRSALDYAKIFFPGSLLEEVKRITLSQIEAHLEKIRHSNLPRHFVPGYEQAINSQFSQATAVAPEMQTSMRRRSLSHI
jgi:ankyrin repeat protein